jgi:mercuric ion transport protein
MSRTWKQSLVALPGVGVSLLPKLACPLCWPAYAGLLSSVGLGFLISTKYLLPLTIAFLVIALGALAFRAKNRQGYGPFVLGLIAAIGVLVGKFDWDSNPALYGAVVLLVVASLWNAWPHRVTSASCCAEKSMH